MSTQEIISKLQDLGFDFDEKIFLQDVQNYYSAEEISEKWFSTFKVTAKDWDEDFPWFAAWVLWERLAPNHIISLEKLDDMIEEGYTYLSEDDYIAACDSWLKVWEALRYRVRPENKDLDYIEKQYEGSFRIREFCKELEYNLFNAGEVDKEYFRLRINYCNEFCKNFPNEAESILYSMKSAIAESYIPLHEVHKAEEEYRKLIQTYPDNPWSYVYWGDMYCIYEDVLIDLEKAKAYYEKGLSLAIDKEDISIIKDRLKELNRM
jgi:tetratricopeptide (TPR) repeat protein